MSINVHWCPLEEKSAKRTQFLLWTVAAILQLTAPTFAQVVFDAKFDANLRPEPATGRLIVYVAKATTKPTPANLDHWEMLFGTDVNDLAPGSIATVDDSAAFHPRKLSALAEGNYLAQAVLRIDRQDSNWRREPGNLYSPVIPFTVNDRASRVTFPLSQVVKPPTYPTTQGAEIFQTPSKLLSNFHHRPMMLRAAVVFPRDRDPSRQYPTIYRIPGFGGNGISMVAHPSASFEDGPAGEILSRNVFHIWLDPESANGHDLCANSDNNGPVGDAIVRELIPALEKKYNLIPQPEARIVRGHSSGGWAALWLQLQYPETFGACFAASPDPVDFRHLEQIDIYNFDNAYEHEGKPLVGSRAPAAATVREENAVEEVLGPHNTSSHDWDAWQAVWGTRDATGHVAALFDPVRGKIDHQEAESYRRYDITNLLVKDPERYLAIFHQRIRLIVGDKDNFFLNDAVACLKAELDKMPAVPGNGYVKILPGYTHASISNAPEFKAVAEEMLDHLKEHSLVQGNGS